MNAFLSTRRFFSILLWLLVANAQAAILPIPAAPAVAARSHILMDHHSHRVLAEGNPDQHMDPASITKVMTAYVIFNELRSGEIKLTDQVTISEQAWRTGGSRMFIEVGKRVSVNDLLQGMIVQSGNDATVALAEHVAGSEALFAALMNRHAQELGLRNTHFKNSTGLSEPGHYTSARDIALLASAMIAAFPDNYKKYSQREFRFNNITQHNRNMLLWRDPSVDGIKTGYTAAAGYCLASSAQRDGMRLISVVLGSANEQVRARESLALLNYGFRFYETRRLYAAGKPVTQARIWEGVNEQLPLGLAEDLYLTLPRGQYRELNATMQLLSAIKAPAVKGDRYGTVRVALGDKTLVEKPLVALSAIDRGSLWQRLVDTVTLRFFN